jgi:hypothetical protein
VPGDHDISSYCPWFDARHWNHHELFRSGARLAPDALGVFALPREREAIADHLGMSAYRLQGASRLLTACPQTVLARSDTSFSQ